MLSEVPDNTVAIIESFVLTNVGVEQLTEGDIKDDRRIRQAVAQIVFRLATYSKDSPANCHALGAQGCFDLAKYYLLGHDVGRKSHAVQVLGRQVAPYRMNCKQKRSTRTTQVIIPLST